MGPRLTLERVLARNAVHFRDRPAVSDGDRSLTHGELDARARRLGRAMLSAGIRARDRVAVLSMNSTAYLEIAGACWCTGIALATVNYRLAEEEMRVIVNDASPRALFYAGAYADLVRALRPRLPTVALFVQIDGEPADPDDATRAYEAFIADLPVDATAELPGPDEEDIANLVYTSGTTGKPKGCINTHRASYVTFSTLALTQGGGSTDRLLCVMPLFHIGAINIVMSTLIVGGSVIIHRAFEAARVVRTLADARVTIVLLAPTMVELVLEEPEIEQLGFEALRRIVYSASPMRSPTLRRAIARFGPILVQYYGQTEIATSFLPPEFHRPDGTEAEQALLVSAGLPFPGTELRIVDDALRDCAPGEAGEVLVRSVAGFGGYWNNHAATLEASLDGWFRSGDIGRLDANGFLFLLDRKKDMIISGGENIYCREVEEALVQHPGVAEIAVFGVPDPVWGEVVGATVVRAPGSTVGADALIEHCRTLIASYKKPRIVVFADSLPKLPSGKINKVALRDAYASSAA